ncbi:MAG: apolipoprotein N-acyltransferase, partial [Candidatus Omnitrophota bacterium]
MKSLKFIKIKDFIPCLISAILLIFSFPPFNLWILAWFSFLPLFLALNNKTFLKSFFLGFFTGFIFFINILHWIIHVTLLGYILLTIYLAIYFGVFGIFFKILQNRPNLLTLGLACSWIILEYLRSHMGNISFSWASLSHSQTSNLAFIQIADIGGSYLVSFILILINIFIWQIIKKQKKNIIYLFILIILIYSYGFFKLKEPVSKKTIRISIIQPDIAQELKRNGNENFILSKTFSLAQDSLKNKPNLIIWPEASFPGYWDIDLLLQEKVLDYIRQAKINLLLGSARIEKNEEEYFFNSAILLSPGKPSQIYNKIRLVPFGEYIPLRKIFGFLETIVFIGDFTKGKEYKIFTIPIDKDKVQFSVLICFEDTFSDLARSFVQNGAEFLINITNDAWFKKTTAPYQHMQSSILRAIENRRSLVRSA